MKKVKHVHTRVVGHQKDGLWHLAALDLGVEASGSDLDQVKQSLGNRIGAIAALGIVQGDSSSLWKDADPKWWKLYEQLKARKVSGYLNTLRVDVGNAGDS